MTRAEPATILYAAWAPFFSGAERALVMLIEHLDPARYRPVVAVGTRGELEAVLRERRVPTVHVPVRYSSVRHLPGWLSTVGRLVWTGRGHRVGLVHANDVPSFQPAGYAARLLGCPAVAHVRFPDNARGYEWFLRPRFDRALFVSASLRDEAVREAPGVFADRSDVVYDGVDVPEPAGADARRLIRDELGLPHDLTVVALIGQVAEVKGLWEFIDAAGILAARQVPVLFVVVGDDLKNNGALKVEAEQAVKARGLEGHVTFLGFRRDAQRLIPAFDIVAAPSHVEPLGLTMLEGMAAGLPVIGARVGGIRETVIDGETGLLVPPRDAARLADAIESLARDPGRRRALGCAGRRRVQETFSVEAHAAQVQAVYDRLRGVR